MITNKKFTNVEIENNSKMIREIILNNITTELEEMSDKYGIDKEILDSIELSLYLTHTDKVIWQGGKTRFVKVFEKGLNEMVDNQDLTFEEVGILTYIASKYTNYEDNIIRVEDEYASKQMLIGVLKEVTKGQSRSSDSHFKRLLSSLEKKKAILSIENPTNKRKKIYYLSPILFYKGQYIDKTVKEALIKKLNES